MQYGIDNSRRQRARDAVWDWQFPLSRGFSVPSYTALFCASHHTHLIKQLPFSNNIAQLPGLAPEIISQNLRTIHTSVVAECLQSYKPNSIRSCRVPEIKKSEQTLPCTCCARRTLAQLRSGKSMDRSKGDLAGSQIRLVCMYVPDFYIAPQCVDTPHSANKQFILLVSGSCSV